MCQRSEIIRIGTADHEAGHVVVGISYGRVPVSSSILPDGKGLLGETEFDETPGFAMRGPDYWADPQYRHHITGCVAGQLAGTLAHDHKEPGRAHDSGDAYDESEARQLIEDQVPHEFLGDSLEQARQAANDLLTRHWRAVEVVAAGLLEHDTLDRAVRIHSAISPNREIISSA